MLTSYVRGIATFLVVVFGYPALCCGDEAIRAEILSDFEAFNSRIAESSHGIVKQSHSVFEHGPDQEATSFDVEYEFAFGGKSSVYDRTQSMQGGAVYRTAVGFNDEYFFRLKQEVGSNRWLIDSLALGVDTRSLIARRYASQDRLSKTPLQIQFAEVFSFFAIEGLLFSDVLSGSTIRQPSDRLVESELETAIPLPQMMGELAQAQLLFEKTDKWRIKRYSAVIEMENSATQARHGYKQTATFDWEPTQNSAIVTSEVIYEGVSAMNSPGGSAKFSVLSLKHETRPQSRFRLTHYGLPEPGKSQGSARSRFLIASLAVGVILVVVLSRIRARTT